MKTYEVSFEENGGEYVGYLYVTCNEIEQTGEKVFVADGIEIEIDEDIIDIREIDD